MRRADYEHGDAIWEHKRGKVWLIVKKLERENRALRYQNKILKVRLSRRSCV